MDWERVRELVDLITFLAIVGVAYCFGMVVADIHTKIEEIHKILLKPELDDDDDGLPTGKNR